MSSLFLERPDGRIAYDDTGDAGPVVVCVPGAGDVRAEYRLLRPLLQQAGYRVVTMDLRGLGESSVAWPDYTASATGSDIVALVRQLAAGPVILLGDSYGAGAAAWAAAAMPNDVAGLVLIGPFVRDVELSAEQQQYLAHMITLLQGPQGVDTWLAYYASLYPHTLPADFDDYAARLGQNLREPGRFAALLAMLAASKADVEARLPNVRAATLVVMGTADPDFADPHAEARLVAQRLAGEVVLLDGAGHYPHAEMPDQVAPAIIAFANAVFAPQ